MIRKTTNTFARNLRIVASLAIAASLTALVACEKQEETHSKLVPAPPAAAKPGIPPYPEDSDTYVVADIVEKGTQPVEGNPDTEVVFDIVQDEAQPVGGMAAFYQQLGDNLVYPQQARDNKIEGTAFVRFVIDESGNVTAASIVEGRELGYGLDEAAIAAVANTKWMPAKQRGTLVKQRKILPVKFKLNSQLQ